MCRESVVRIEGVTWSRQREGEWEVQTPSPMEKNETWQIIGLQRVWFKWRLFERRFCTQPQIDIHSGPPRSLEVRKAAEKTAKMPVDLNGYWKMISSDNFEEYLKALGE